MSRSRQTPTHRVGILMFPDVQQLDLAGPFEVFASLPDTEVLLVACDAQPVRSSTGMTILPTATFSTCPPLDVICVPGGTGIDALLDDRETLDFIRMKAKSARFVTSVCTGALVLGAAGLLRGRKATTHWAFHDLLAAFGAIPVATRVVRDGNLITGGGVTAGLDFGLTVAAELAGRAEAEAVQLFLEYAPAPPFSAGDPDTAPTAVVEAVRERLSAGRRRREDRVTAIMGASTRAQAASRHSLSA